MRPVVRTRREAAFRRTPCDNTAIVGTRYDGPAARVNANRPGLIEDMSGSTDGTVGSRGMPDISSASARKTVEVSTVERVT